MAATGHMPWAVNGTAVARARSGDNVVLDADGEGFRLEALRQSTPPFTDIGPIRIERTDCRPLDEILADPNKVWSEGVLDDQWANDMEAIMKENRSHDRDVCAE